MTLCTSTRLILLGMYTSEIDVAHSAKTLISVAVDCAADALQQQRRQPLAHCTSAPPNDLRYGYGFDNSSFVRAAAAPPTPLPPPPPPQPLPPPPPSCMHQHALRCDHLHWNGGGWKSGCRRGAPINLRMIEVCRVRQVCQWWPHRGRQYISECLSHHASLLQHCQQHERNGRTHHWAALQCNGLQTSLRQKYALCTVCFIRYVLTHTYLGYRSGLPCSPQKLGPI